MEEYEKQKQKILEESQNWQEYEERIKNFAKKWGADYESER